MQKIFSKPYAAHALPRKFRRLRLLVIGCGDVGMRLLSQVTRANQMAQRCNLGRQHAIHCVATTRRKEQSQAIRAMGCCQPLLGDLGNPAFAKRIVSLASRIIMLAPPPNTGSGDPISLKLALLLRSKGHQQRDQQQRTQYKSIARKINAQQYVSYVSTTGVYGDCQGRWVAETSPTNAVSARAQRRVQAEKHWQSASATGAVRVSILRAPGIYAAERLPLERLQRGTPAICHTQDSYSNHIHADDLARLAWIANLKSKGSRIFNAVDQEPMLMGDYFDKVADHFALPRPARLPRDQVQKMVNPMMWSFMNESRRIKASRFCELKFILNYPTVDAFLSKLEPLNKPRSEAATQ